MEWIIRRLTWNLSTMKNADGAVIVRFKQVIYIKEGKVVTTSVYTVFRF